MQRFKNRPNRSGQPKLVEFSHCAECWKKNQKSSKDQKTTNSAVFDVIGSISNDESNSESELDSPQGLDQQSLSSTELAISNDHLRPEGDLGPDPDTVPPLPLEPSLYATGIFHLAQRA